LGDHVALIPCPEVLICNWKWRCLNSQYKCRRPSIQRDSLLGMR
jgi:hypothetical protein